MINQLPVAVNWHLEARCNYRCKFCFVKFKKFHHAHVHDEGDVASVFKQLRDAGVQKLTFVGGEPMLHPQIRMGITLASRMGLTTCLVSNGTRLTRAWLGDMRPHLDWLGLSIDASSDDLHAKMGRANVGELRRDVSDHLSRATCVWENAQSMGYGMKLNTVVCDVNKDDDMCHLIERLQPERWKVFRVLQVRGENDDHWDDLGITQRDFDMWVSRHRHLDPVVEDNDDMLGSYAMIDAKGRFFTDATGENIYTGRNIFDHGVTETWAEIQGHFSPSKFSARGGDWSWK